MIRNVFAICDQCDTEKAFDDWDEFFAEGWIRVEHQQEWDDEEKEYVFCDMECLSNYAMSRSY